MRLFQLNVVGHDRVTKEDAPRSCRGVESNQLTHPVPHANNVQAMLLFAFQFVDNKLKHLCLLDAQTKNL